MRSVRHLIMAIGGLLVSSEIAVRSQCMTDSRLQASGQVGEAPQQKTLVGTQGLHEVHYCSELLQPAQRSGYPQSVHTVVRPDQFVLADISRLSMFTTLLRVDL